MTSIFFVTVRIWSIQFKCNYLKNKKLFLYILLRCWNLNSMLNILEKQINLIAYVFPNFRTAKDVVMQMSKKPRFRTPFDSQHVKGSQTLVKSAWHQFYHIFSPLWAKLTWIISLLVICQILGHFRNTLTANEKYSLRNRELARQPIQMQLSKKQIPFSKFLEAYLKLTSILEEFETKMTLIAYKFSKLRSVKDVVR